MRTWILTAAVALLASAASTTASTIAPPQELKCPVGGKSFEHSFYMSYSTWGQRPDGKPYGSGEFPVTPPICPDNGLIMYREFTKAEIKALEGLLASAEYQALRETDTPFFRVAWIEKALNPKSEKIVWYLLNASWEADDDAVLKMRYQRAFLNLAETLPAKPEDETWLAIRLRVMNAYRELGEFDKAQAVYDALNVEALSKGLPVTREEAFELRDEKKRNRWALVDYLKRLHVVLVRGDRRSEPLDMMRPWDAARICFYKRENPEALNAFDRAYCATPEIMQEIERGRDIWGVSKAERDAARAKLNGAA
ncbi:hypothetical protein PQU92_03210 [Asticcacaulis sp. BYS171W]|uniref:Tetratricopeptide repeat protein n=1 Tax=Asticcacaulis aquaticus TaxID=2984212 RepID=A0ABT5HQP6_9CAUL|nr:hypothetical protein [Asticcacaulis aquaticus]MDC7682267.1 hypothetical protein [Asticcacaulis aquaticus]